MDLTNFFENITDDFPDFAENSNSTALPQIPQTFDLPEGAAFPESALPQGQFQFMKPASTGSFLLPGSEALVPLNPLRWPAHAAATALTDQYRVDLGNPLKTLENMDSTCAYLATSTSPTQYVERLQKVMFDTGVITALHEVAPGAGAVIAGDYANQMCAQYDEEAVNDLINPRPEDDFSYITRTQKSLIEDGKRNDPPEAFEKKISSESQNQGASGEDLNFSTSNSSKGPKKMTLRLRGPGKPGSGGGGGSPSSGSDSGPEGGLSSDRQPLNEYVGLTGENLNPEQKTYVQKNLFIQPRRSNRPVWSYKPFNFPGGRGGGIVDQAVSSENSLPRGPGRPILHLGQVNMSYQRSANEKVFPLKPVVSPVVSMNSVTDIGRGGIIILQKTNPIVRVWVIARYPIGWLLRRYPNKLYCSAYGTLNKSVGIYFTIVTGISVVTFVAKKYSLVKSKRVSLKSIRQKVAKKYSLVKSKRASLKSIRQKIKERRILGKLKRCRSTNLFGPSLA